MEYEPEKNSSKGNVKMAKVEKSIGSLIRKLPLLLK